MDLTADRTRKWEQRILTGLAGIVWIYLALRAAYVPLSHDETATFFHFVQPGQFIPYTGILWDANNHLLNSFLSYLSFQAFGSSEFALRLPALLLVPLYFFFHERISRRIEHPLPRWAYLFAVLCTHYIIEYLAYCRGYGMSLVFLTGSVHFAMLYYETKELKNFLALLFLTLLALLANLSLLYPVLILFAYGFFLLGRQAPSMDPGKRANAFVGSVLSLLVLALCIKFLFDLKEAGALYMGGEAFIDVSLHSLSEAFFYTAAPPYTAFLILLGALALIAALLSLGRKLGTERNKLLEGNALFAYLFFGPLLAIHAAHFIMDVNYPEARAIMYLYPLLVGALCFGVDRLKGGIGKLLIRSLPLLLLLIPLRGLAKINLSYQTHPPFRLQRVPERYIETILQRSENWKEKATVAGYHLRHFVYAFHNYRNGGKLNPFHRKGYPEPAADFQIVDTSKAPRLKKPYRVIDHDPITNYSLLQRKERAERIPIRTRSISGTDGLIEEPFFDLFKLDPIPDSLKGERVILEMDLGLHSPEAPFEGRIVIAATDASGNKLHYDYFGLDWLKFRWNEERFAYDRYVPGIPEDAEELRLYLWNPSSTPFAIEPGKVRLSEYAIPKGTQDRSDKRR